MKWIGPSVRRVFKFGITGILGVSINYAIFATCLIVFDFHYSISGALGFIVPIPLAYFIQAKWVFESEVNFRSDIFRYCMIIAMTLTGSLITQWATIRYFDVSELFSQAYGILVSSGGRYYAEKILIFKVG